MGIEPVSVEDDNAAAPLQLCLEEREFVGGEKKSVLRADLKKSFEKVKKFGFVTGMQAENRPDRLSCWSEARCTVAALWAESVTWN